MGKHPKVVFEHRNVPIWMDSGNSYQFRFTQNTSDEDWISMQRHQQVKCQHLARGSTLDVRIWRL